MILSKHYLGKLEADQLLDLARFIVTENFKHHTNAELPQEYKQDITSIYEEELNYFEDSDIIVAKDGIGGIVGAIRVLKWNYMDQLPLQKIFGINPLLAITQESIEHIYHIGRFAIMKNVGDLNLFKKLMVCAIAPVCKHKNNIAFAECDSKLLRILNLLGIKTAVIGESVDYLGSETIPVAMSYNGLIDFYNKNKSLLTHDSSNLEDAIIRLHESVVFNSQNVNYSLV